MSRTKKSDKKKKPAAAKDADPAADPQANGSNGGQDGVAAGMVNGAVSPFRIRLNYHEPQQDIHIEKITIQYGSHVVMKDQKLTLVYGRRYGLVGRNGSGKSSLLRKISGREFTGITDDMDILYVDKEAPPSDKTALEVVLASDWEREMLLAEEERILDTDPLDSARLDDVYERLAQIDADTAEARASAVLAGLEFRGSLLTQPVRELSGGWRMRLALACALFRTPSLLILNQPQSHLDLHSSIWLEEYLASYPKTLLVVSHSPSFLDGVCNSIIYCAHRRLTAYTGNYSTFLKTKAEEDIRMQRDYDKQQKEIARLQDVIERSRDNPKTAGQLHSRERVLTNLASAELELDEEEKEIRFHFPECGELTHPILGFHDVTFGYSEDKILYKDLDFGIDLNSRIALVGPNGIGKSTLLSLFSGEREPLEGWVERNKFLRIGVYNQHAVDTLPMEMSAFGLLARESSDGPVSETEDRALHKAITDHLESFSIEGKQAHSQLGVLSAGETLACPNAEEPSVNFTTHHLQRARVAFAKIAWRQPHIILLDEPTNSLDIETIDALVDAMEAFNGGIVVVSHSRDLIDRTCKQIWVCGRDQSVQEFEGTFQDYRRQLVKQMRKDKVLRFDFSRLAI